MIHYSLRSFVAGLVILAGATLRADEISVFAAASLTDALREIATTYEKQSGDKIVFNFGASSTLGRQIEEGAPADIFFSADEAKMDGLEKKELIIRETRKSLLSNSLVIVVAARGGPAIESANDLGADKVKRLALAEPNTVPAGIYAKEYLEKKGLWSAVKSKIIPTESVRAALSAVESGNVDAGIVYKTDAAISKKVRVALAIPPGEGPEIRYPIAVVRESRIVARARKFVEYLDSEDAWKVFQRYGFIRAKKVHGQESGGDRNAAFTRQQRGKAYGFAAFPACPRLPRKRGVPLAVVVPSIGAPDFLAL